LDLASNSLVAGHYLPLADNPGIAPEPDQTCSLQSDQRTLQNQGLAQALRCSLQRRPVETGRQSLTFT
jgi:hypothetical protein